jgi:hypothetical protein
MHYGIVECGEWVHSGIDQAKKRIIEERAKNDNIKLYKEQDLMILGTDQLPDVEVSND